MRPRIKARTSASSVRSVLRARRRHRPELSNSQTFGDLLPGQYSVVEGLGCRAGRSPASPAARAARLTSRLEPPRSIWSWVRT